MTSILVAPDSFKGTFSSVQVAQYIAAGIRDEGLSATECPLADGGEGTLDVLLLALSGEQRFHLVQGPMGRKSSRLLGAGCPSNSWQLSRWRRLVGCISAVELPPMRFAPQPRVSVS